MKNNLANAADLYNLSCFAKKNELSNLLSLNPKLEEKGYCLTESQARMLISNNADSLRDNARIEIGKSIVTELASAFSDSSYIAPAEFADKIALLTDTFYTLRDTIPYSIADDELLQAMFELFEHRCGGDIDVLAEQDIAEYLAPLPEQYDDDTEDDDE